VTALARIAGIVPPVVTPLTEEGAVDPHSLRRLIDHLIQGGVHGLFVLGSSGEFSLLTDHDRAAVITTAVEAVRGRVPLLAGITDTSTARCIEQGQLARSAGVGGVVLAAPYYAPYSQTELVGHFRAVREAIDLPVFAYDIPSMVKVKLGLDTLQQLASDGTIVGLKDSSGDDTGLRQLIIATRSTGSLRIFTGNEVLVDCLLLAGAHGAVPGLANVAPADFVRLYAAAVRGDWGEARRRQERLVTLFGIVRQGLNTGMSFSASALGGFKSALTLGGIIGTNAVGRPMARYTPDQVSGVKAVLDSYRVLT
jgi:4-hydroxy-tetrahydrodipicolinate synthase